MLWDLKNFSKTTAGNSELVNYIVQNGLQGIVKEIAGFLDKILNGTAS
jgi:hypothetical protein